MYGVNITTAPVGKVINTADLQKHCEIATADSSHDDYLDLLLVAAVELFEEMTGCHLLSRTADYYIDKLPRADTDSIYFPHYPVTSIGDLQYKTSEGTQTYTTGNLVRSTTRKPASLAPVEGASWPDPLDEPDSVIIKDVVTGYGADSIPTSLKQSLLLLVGFWFENRQSVITGSIASELPFATKIIWETYRLRCGYFKLQEAY